MERRGGISPPRYPYGIFDRKVGRLLPCIQNLPDRGREFSLIHRLDQDLHDAQGRCPGLNLRFIVHDIGGENDLEIVAEQPAHTKTTGRHILRAFCATHAVVTPYGYIGGITTRLTKIRSIVMTGIVIACNIAVSGPGGPCYPHKEVVGDSKSPAPLISRRSYEPKVV